MKGDFTRETFHAASHYSRVLQQQGRVTLDADPNEQTAILLHLIRTLARDLIGPYAAPYENGGFLITQATPGGFLISPGRYYVDGIMVENSAPCTYLTQPDYPLPADDLLAAEIKSPLGKTFGLYLDVWERLITPIDDNLIREKALSGPDTALRAKVVWQVKAAQIAVPASNSVDRQPNLPPCDSLVQNLVAVSPASMAARVDPGDPPDDPCILPPSARYRGPENQLYRVEIHTGGTASVATFKWARDNGSRVSAWLGTNGTQLQVADSRGFDAGNWVELIDDGLELHGLPGALVRIIRVDPGALTLDPASVAGATPWTAALVNPKVRRWDQVQTGATTLNNGAVPVQEGNADTALWLSLEDGVQIAFSPGGIYRTGDYWQIPARVATGDIEWLQVVGTGNVTSPASLPPKGITHHYAPLGFVRFVGDAMNFSTCRCVFEPASSCFQLGSLAIGAHLLQAPPPSQPANVVLTAPAGAETQQPLNLLR
jgi:hypothetical protein